MYEVLASLDDRARVLDLGSGPGSFPVPSASRRVVRADRELSPVKNDGAEYVICSADQVPFRSGVFEGIILNHSLEHLDNLDTCLEEIGRVASPGCKLYITVPDASTITDRIYRWLGRGGGHVNPFVDPVKLAARVSRQTGLRHSATRTLRTSLCFLHRANLKERRPTRMVLFLNGSETLLRIGTFVLRRCDELLGTRWSVYGWAMYFGPIDVPTMPEVTNVCIRCGAGHPAAWLTDCGLVRRRRWMPDHFQCPGCGTGNYFTHDLAAGG